MDKYPTESIVELISEVCVPEFDRGLHQEWRKILHDDLAWSNSLDDYESTCDPNIITGFLRRNPVLLNAVAMKCLRNGIELISSTCEYYGEIKQYRDLDEEDREVGGMLQDLLNEIVDLVRNQHPC